MTPEERAGAAASLYHEDYLGDGGTVPPLEVIIADAIREAENEALERAAVHIETLATTANLNEAFRMGMRFANSAEAIRALKHPV